MLNKKREKFTVDGVGEINSIEEMSKKSGYSIKYVLLQRGKGATDEEIYHGIKSDFICDDVVYKNPAEFKRAYGITIGNHAVVYRLQKGASLEELVDQARGIAEPSYYILTNNGRKVVLDGVEYDNTTKAYEAKKDDPRVTDSFGTIKQRKLIYLWSDEKAFFGKDYNKEEYFSKN
ncbi:hypothetical protein [Vreelandella neptunia]|jgi:hypothetical protein|uniref:Uncharacterized protein n=1 Tax=Vreelandella neptunia TaxID=115551 RepID=A0ABS9S9P8_9GAMM|nr:hypothetical protein [Halomonas neptunia]MCH4812842.1 hypothetical protein [Halomonas neptunia]